MRRTSLTAPSIAFSRAAAALRRHWDRRRSYRRMASEAATAARPVWRCSTDRWWGRRHRRIGRRWWIGGARRDGGGVAGAIRCAGARAGIRAGARAARAGSAAWRAWRIRRLERGVRDLRALLLRVRRGIRAAQREPADDRDDDAGRRRRCRRRASCSMTRRRLRLVMARGTGGPRLPVPGGRACRASRRMPCARRSGRGRGRGATDGFGHGHSPRGFVGCVRGRRRAAPARVSSSSVDASTDLDARRRSRGITFARGSLVSGRLCRPAPCRPRPFPPRPSAPLSRPPCHRLPLPLVPGALPLSCLPGRASSSVALRAAASSRFRVSSASRWRLLLLCRAARGRLIALARVVVSAVRRASSSVRACVQQRPGLTARFLPRVRARLPLRAACGRGIGFWRDSSSARGAGRFIGARPGLPAASR